MNEQSNASREQQLNDVMAGYLQAVDAGQPPDREEFLARHPDLADELAVFLSNQGHLKALAVPADPDATVAPDGTSGRGPMVRYLGDYELLDELARGGMGVVYRARQVSLNRVIALKMILAGNLATEAEVRRFQAEAEAVANLEHPNIVPIYEIGAHEGPALLQHEADRGRQPERPVKEMVVQDPQQPRPGCWPRSARAVHHAHQAAAYCTAT